MTDGDRLECEIKYGWEVQLLRVWVMLAELAATRQLRRKSMTKMAEYTEKYTMATDNVTAVREQARYEVAIEKFIAANGVNAFTDTFQDLHGLAQLPGIAAQNLMEKGIGFGPEGDYKISALFCRTDEDGGGTQTVRPVLSRTTPTI